jgi:hypothetical protein
VSLVADLVALPPVTCVHCGLTADLLVRSPDPETRVDSRLMRREALLLSAAAAWRLAPGIHEQVLGLYDSISRAANQDAVNRDRGWGLEQ